MIKDQLFSQGKQTTNVQVNVFEVEVLSLEDAEGTFLQAPPLDSAPNQGSVQKHGTDTVAVLSLHPHIEAMM